MISARFERKRLIKRWPERLAEVNKRFLPKAALNVEADAVRLVPVDSGRLKGSITSRVDDDRAIIGSNVEYAPHVEYGTKFMRAQPYLRPAIDRMKKPLIDLYKQIFRSVYGR
jgi:HK97 gp10 family phage protein